MRIETPDTTAAETLADLWVDLAEEQRQYGSHLQGADNREAMQIRISQAIVTDNARVAVADADGEFPADTILGYISFARTTDELATDVDQGKIQNLYVRPACRDQGIGTALLERASDILAARGVDAVSLEVMADNEAARRFYRRQGFEHHRIHLTRPVESDTHSKE